jgi:DNA-binding transcriptional LysR family regulator
MTISFNKLDLNLLRVFNVVMEENSVLRASQRVCLSQSAVSHALTRLRGMLDDELFIRTPTGMQPTARALTMAPLIREAWRSLEAAIGTPNFEPSKSARRFTIATSELVTTVIVPNLLKLLRREAPSLQLIIRPDSGIDLMEQIYLGKIDAAVGTFSQVPERLRSHVLFTYDDVLITSSSKWLRKLSIDTLSRLELAAVSLQSEYAYSGALGGLSRQSEMFDRAALESAASTSKRASPITLLVPHFLALPALLTQTDLAAIAPRPLACSLARTHPLSIYEMPYKTRSAAVRVLWHERSEKDLSQEWLRDTLWRATEPLRHASIQRQRTPSPKAPPLAITTEATRAARAWSGCLSTRSRSAPGAPHRDEYIGSARDLP